MVFVDSHWNHKNIFALKFSKITGLTLIKETLLASVRNKHVAHAQLFMGNVGCANLALALAYVQYINCENQQETDSCGSCASCIQFSKMVHPDLHLVFPMANLEKINKEDLKAHSLKHFRPFVQENPFADIHDWGQYIGAENKQFSISVEEGRSIIQYISMKSFQAEFKIVLIWLPELMHSSTSNAILKALEEPPPKTIFILVANDIEKIIPTILSRCQLVYVPAFSEAETKQYLIENKQVDEKNALRIAKISDGNLNKAQQLISQEPDDSHETFATWMRLCFGRKYQDLLIFSEDLSKRGRENQKNMLLYGLQIVRDSLMVSANAIELVHQDENELKFIEKFSGAVNQKRLPILSEILTETFLHIERNGNGKIVFFDTSLKITNLMM